MIRRMRNGAAIGALALGAVLALWLVRGPVSGAASTGPTVLRALIYDQQVQNGSGGGILLENAVGVKRVQRFGTGTYLITFDRDVSTCAFSVTAAIVGYTFVPPTPYAVPVEGQPPELVGINTGIPGNKLAPPPNPKQVWVTNESKAHDAFYIVADC